MRSLQICFFGLSLGANLLAQDATPGWHRFGERADGSANAPFQGAAPATVPQQQQYPAAGITQSQSMPLAQPPYQPQPQFQQQPYATAPQGPIELTIPPGTWITARINEPLSSDHSQPGDAFMATLAQPLVINGLVVARRGQTVQGRVSDVFRAGRVKGTSRIGIELTELSLVDGQQMPLKTQFVERRGGTSVGDDIGAIGITTGLGAAIGAVAGGGWGAGIGALAGAAIGTTGVLATRGRETVIFPEQVLTFRVEAPVHIYSQAANAFQPGLAMEYDREQPHYAQAPPARPSYSVYPYSNNYYGDPYYGSFGGGSFYGGSGFYFGRGGGYGGSYGRGGYGNYRHR